MIETAGICSYETEGVGYGTRRGHVPRCHKGSIGCSAFMSTIFNE